jgi:molybdate transport system ATP-binding protein
VLDAAFTKRLREFELTVKFTADEASTLVLVGETGSGKSTVLNILAGFLSPDRGRVALDGDVYVDSDHNIAVAPYLRPIGYVFQDYALFPHLTAVDNVAFGLRSQGVGARAARRRAHATLKQLGIADLAESRPAKLSGGQQQRVALARALILQPRLLLLDEPLSALDLQTRQQIRSELRRILSELSCITVLVTHSAFEAMAFGQRIAVLDRGRIAQMGSREELLAHPRSNYVAGLMGVNLFRGRVVAGQGNGLTAVETAEGRLNISVEGAAGEIFVAIDPHEVTIHTAPPTGSAQNVFFGRIVELVPEPPFGERLRVILDTHPPLVAQITARAAQTLGLREGMAVYASFKATAVNVYG